MHSQHQRNVTYVAIACTNDILNRPKHANHISLLYVFKTRGVSVLCTMSVQLLAKLFRYLLSHLHVSGQKYSFSHQNTGAILEFGVGLFSHQTTATILVASFSPSTLIILDDAVGGKLFKYLNRIYSNSEIIRNDMYLKPKVLKYFKFKSIDIFFHFRVW